MTAQEQAEQEKLNIWYDKIESSIESITNRTQVSVCVNMIGQFNLRFPGNVEDSLALEVKLHEKAVNFHI